jgi:hypothetical protein
MFPFVFFALFVVLLPIRVIRLPRIAVPVPKFSPLRSLRFQSLRALVAILLFSIEIP